MIRLSDKVENPRCHGNVCSCDASWRSFPLYAIQLDVVYLVIALKEQHQDQATKMILPSLHPQRPVELSMIVSF